jgi:isopentenyl-diphosphate Delta-isomerase
MASTDLELLEYVDINDHVLGTATRAEIHRQGLMHRSVHIFVFNDHGEIYLQRRSATKDRHPSKLDSSAAGHVDPGESYFETAQRELEEELGLRAEIKEVLRISACEITDNEHVVLYESVTSVEPAPNAEEIQWGAFVESTELTKSMRENPEDFVPAFVLLWNEYLKRRS